ncbi:type VI secretion system tip protein VgrG [Danxiaibacter flavus]|uniref:Type VI secretion system tip protein VgrG n=1 Tax=Danxiaibacter flavus TaxID=3049108 RepID=A0ABV3ZAG7_9BACT|nr:type VI secretion system tip protein VgrG [Chitinophagaceae bacterium DXS]
MPAQVPGQNIVDPLVRVVIMVNGSAIDEAFAVVSIYVQHEINRISFAEIVLVGDPKPDGNGFDFTNGETFNPGNVIDIKAGYGEDAQDSIFTGYIVKHILETNEGEGLLLRLVCKHKAVAMTMSRKDNQYEQKTDSDIISSIIGQYGLSTQVDSTTEQGELFYQKLATDWDIILSRAEINGFLIFLDGTDVVVGKPKFSADAVLRVAYGESIIEFKGVLNAEKQATSVQASAWDIKTLELIKSTASEPALNSQGNVTAKSLSEQLGQGEAYLSSATPLTQAEIKAWADNHLLRLRLQALKGSVKFIGSALAKTGCLIELAGVGEKFNGNAFVSAVTQEIKDGNWTTGVKFGLDQQYVYEMPGFSYPSAAGQLPGIQGLQVATVSKLSEDPQSLYRIQVSIPGNAESPVSAWARYSNFYGTAAAGAGFFPEVGDEVVIGFLENDPRFPVILGSLYGSKKASPNELKDENNYIKSLTTKSKMKLSFDDEKKIIKIETPAGNNIVFSDDSKAIEITDQNSNSVKMSSSGVEITSNKDIKLTATGNIELSATGKVSISATQDAEVSGLNVNATAQVGFTAKGNATAELSASGQTTVKGAMVMIN